MNYSESLVDFIKGWEASRGPFLEPHWDAIGKVWDIGYGHVLTAGEERRSITAAEAEELLLWDISWRDDGVNQLVKVGLEQHQHDALLAFAYNVGLDIDDDEIAEGLGDSKLLKCVNAGNNDAAAAEFTLWCNSHGKKVEGLLRRRLAEQAMFVRGDYSGRP